MGNISNLFLRFILRGVIKEKNDLYSKEKSIIIYFQLTIYNYERSIMHTLYYQIHNIYENPYIYNQLYKQKMLIYHNYCVEEWIIIWKWMDRHRVEALRLQQQCSPLFFGSCIIYGTVQTSLGCVPCGKSVSLPSMIA